MEILSLKNEFNKLLPEKFKEVLYLCSELAEKNNFNIFLVGGAVRDLILGLKIADIDVIVEGDAVEFAKIIERFSDNKICAIQKELKTAKICFKNGVNVDFASTRFEFYSEKGFLPIIEQFGVPLFLDVKRRDFTVNSLYLPISGKNKFEVIDFVGGIRDIKRQILRVLHSESFVDDPSRMIRGLKFSVRLGFELDDSTKTLQNKYLADLSSGKIPLERIKNEIKDLFSLNNPNAFDEFINQRLYLLISQNVCLSGQSALLKQSSEKFNVSKEDIWLVYFSAIFYPLGAGVYSNLNLTSRERKILVDILEMTNKKAPSGDSNYEIYNFFNEKDTIAIAVYYAYTLSEKAILYIRTLCDIKLDVSGADLINLGLSPSSQFKEILEKVFEKKLNEGFSTYEEELLYLKSLI